MNDAGGIGPKLVLIDRRVLLSDSKPIFLLLLGLFWDALQLGEFIFIELDIIL